LITWQWAPDRGPACQVGKLLSLSRRAALFSQRPCPRSPSPFFNADLPRSIWRIERASKQKAGDEPAFLMSNVHGIV